MNHKNIKSFENVFVTMSDKNGLAQAKTSLTSLLINTKKRNFDILLLTCSKINAVERKWFDKRGIKVVYFKLKTSANIYFRDIYFTVFYLFREELLTQWKHVVFIETDTLIINDIKELFDLDGFYAVPNIGDTSLKAQFITVKNAIRNMGPNLRKEGVFDQKEISRAYKELSKNYELKNKPTFNAGVFVFSTNSLKNFNFDEALKIIEKFSIVSRYGMQGPLNLIFNMRWKKLSKKYNFLVNLERKLTLNQSMPTVVHFAGAFAEQKPWNNRYHTFAHLWILYSFMSKSHEFPLARVIQYLYSLFPQFLNRIIIKIKFSYIQILFEKFKRKLSYVKKSQVLNFKKTFVDIKIRLIYKSFVNIAIVFTVFFLNKKCNSNDSKPLSRAYYQCSDSDFLITIASMLGFNNYCNNVEFAIHKNLYTIFDKIILKKLGRHMGIKVLTSKEINKLSVSLTNYPKTKGFFNYGWSGMKCLLPLLEKEYDKTILLDSDVLFFNNLEEISKWINTKKKYNIYLQDFKRFSIISDVEAKHILGKNLRLKPVNSGLIGFNLNLFSRPKVFSNIERYIKDILKINNTRLTSDSFLKSEYFSTFPLLEQSIHWLLLEGCDSISLPNKGYKVYPPHSLYGEDINDAKCIHYTGDQKRYFIYRQLFYMLIKKILSGKKIPKPWYCFSGECYHCNHPQTPYWY